MNNVLRCLLLSALAAAMTGALGLIMFFAAGRWDLPMMWTWIGIVGAVMVAGFVMIEPGLLKERIRPGPGGRDGRVLIVLKLLAWASFIFAALDVGRLHLSDTVPLGVQIVGLVGFASGLALAIWAMTVNRFFSSVVRLQSERGHHLVTAGPYQYVRHPGYVGVAFGVLCSGPALGSWLSLFPMVLFVLLILRRTVIEDRFLREKLEGYTAYVEKVRHRLIPGVW